MISSQFDIIEHQISNREFVTHTGKINKKRITAISTGIGTDNIDIVINEIDALANINFKTRTINKTHKTLNIIRLGTSGGLQNNIPVDSLIVSSYALGFDGLAHFYKNNDLLEKDFKKAYLKQSNWPKLANITSLLFNLFGIICVFAKPRHLPPQKDPLCIASFADSCSENWAKPL